MRGSEGRKYNGRTTEHDISTRRVAEVIEAATVLADHPDAAAARAALARVASELLKARADTLIDRALKAAPSGAVAQTLQRAVEAASERVLICRNGARTELSLFAIPMIASFEQSVPESQFETALRGLHWQDLVHRIDDGRVGVPRVVLMPNLFRLDELSAMPFSLVRTCGIELGIAGMSSRGGWHRSFAQRGSLKRSTTFLRFLVGQRELLDHDGVAVDDHRLCEHLQVFASRALKRYLRLPLRVEACKMRSFFEGLYSGLWLYEESRLNQLAQTRCIYKCEERRASRPES